MADRTDSARGRCQFIKKLKKAGRYQSIYQEVGKLLLDDGKKGLSMKLLSEDVLKIEDELYFFAKEFNLLFKINIKNNKYTFLGMIPGKNIFAQRLVSKIVCWGEKLYLIPLVSGDVWIYSLNDKSWEKIKVENYENNWADSFFRNAVVYKEKLYLFGGYYPAVVILDLKTNEMTYFREPFLNRNDDKKCCDLYFRGEPVLIDDCIFLASCVDNTLLKFNLENLKYNWIEVGNRENKYSGLVWDGHYFWMAPRHNTSIVQWDGIGKAVEYEVDASSTSGNAYIGIVNAGNSFIIPGINDSLVFQKNGEIQRKKSYYAICKNEDNEILLQFMDGTINIIDSTGKIEEYKFFLDNREFAETIKKINHNKTAEIPKKIIESELFPLELWLAVL